MTQKSHAPCKSCNEYIWDIFYDENSGRVEGEYTLYKVLNGGFCPFCGEPMEIIGFSKPSTFLEVFGFIPSVADKM